MPVVFSAVTDERVVALTFDDGPHPEFTPLLLDALAEDATPATFFVRGSALNDETQPLVKQMVESGHCVANHTHSHRSLGDWDDAVVLDEILKTHADLETLTDSAPDLIRPPYGDAPGKVDAVASSLGYRATVMWGATGVDWDIPAPSPETIVHRIRRALFPGVIVLLHDGCAPEQLGHSRLGTVEAVRQLVPMLKADGYRLVSLAELLHGT